jgi:hypothetical protein
VSIGSSNRRCGSRAAVEAILPGTATPENRAGIPKAIIEDNSCEAIDRVAIDLL